MDKKIGMFCLCALITILVIPPVLRAASFDCSKASTKTEKAICGDQYLSKLDEDMAAAYSKALKTSDRDGIKKEQRRWLKEILSACIEDKVCIGEAYENRLRQLEFSAMKADSSMIHKLFRACSTEPKDEMGLAQCLAEVADKTDRYLQEMDKRIVTHLDSHERKLFLKASKAWFQFVDFTCDYDTNSLGSMTGSIVSSCHIQLHQSRIKALEKYEKCLLQEDCAAPLLLYVELSPDN